MSRKPLVKDTETPLSSVQQNCCVSISELRYLEDAQCSPGRWLTALFPVPCFSEGIALIAPVPDITWLNLPSA